jgi:hypothetical protein
MSHYVEPDKELLKTFADAYKEQEDRRHPMTANELAQALREWIREQLDANEKEREQLGYAANFMVLHAQFLMLKKVQTWLEKNGPDPEKPEPKPEAGKRKPTIGELQAILDSEEKISVVELPNGEIRAIEPDAGKEKRCTCGAEAEFLNTPSMLRRTGLIEHSFSCELRKESPEVMAQKGLELLRNTPSLTQPTPAPYSAEDLPEEIVEAARTTSHMPWK